ncbi:MAG: ribose ABC transporter permease [Spirochaetes bacterium DG_61]|jgi:ribose transport system permease protein|nr:MAG: ribose ABC transporter permease [Spirochaetes bacterium DG_61]
MILQRLKFLRQYGILAVLIVLVIFFSLTTSAFLKTENLFNITRQVAMLGISAVGMSFVILTAGIDLSVGSLMSLTNVVCAKLMVEGGVHPVLAVFITLLMTCIIGMINGTIITLANIPPLITTLGMMTTLRGISYVLCSGYPIWGFPERFRVLGQGYVGPIPIPVIIMILIFIIGWIFLNKTMYGRYVYGIGGNEEASRLSGINVRNMKYMVYILCSFLTGVASMIMLSRINTGQPKVGSGFELEVITAVVLGGVSIFGGQGKLIGVFIGVLIMGVLSNGMIIMNISEYWQLVVRGLVLLAAVGVDNLSSMKLRST